MDPRPIVRAVIGLTAFLELSGSDLVDEDSAMAQLESMTDNLSKLDEESKAIFENELRVMEMEAESKKDKQLSNFYREFASNYGLR